MQLHLKVLEVRSSLVLISEFAKGEVFDLSVARLEVNGSHISRQFHL